MIWNLPARPHRCLDLIRYCHLLVGRAYTCTFSLCKWYRATLIIWTPLSAGWLLPYWISEMSGQLKCLRFSLDLWYLAYKRYLYGMIVQYMASSVQNRSLLISFGQGKACRACSSSLNMYVTMHTHKEHWSCHPHACLCIFWCPASLDNQGSG